MQTKPKSDIQTYLEENNAFDIASLRALCAHNSVEVITSPKYPTLAMLHYSREAQLESNWNPLSRISRGLILDLKNRRVLARPFDKFFNIDEQPETRLTNLMKLGKFEVMEKLDGSMLILFRSPEDGKLVLTTKGSFESEHGKYATSILPLELEKADLDKYTYMFELVTHKKELRENLVVDYVKKGYSEGVYLIGVRNNETGLLETPSIVKDIAQDLGIPVFKTYEFDSLDDMVHHAKNLPVLEEGFVIHFEDNNLLVKLKGEDYKRAHRFISKLSPTYLLEGLMYDSIDELIELAPEEYREDVIKQVEEFKSLYSVLNKHILKLFEAAPKTDQRKDFAMWVQKNVESDLKAYMFTLYDKKEIPKWKIYKTIGERKDLKPRILK